MELSWTQAGSLFATQKNVLSEIVFPKVGKPLTGEGTALIEPTSGVPALGMAGWPLGSLAVNSISLVGLIAVTPNGA